MTVLLVLALLAIALTVDYLLTHRHPAPVEAPRPAMLPRPLISAAGGFRLMDGFRYHPGHTWAVAETPELVRVGIDDFAARVSGALSNVATPARGQWIRQGQKVFTLDADGGEYTLVSPVDGVVFDVNERVLADPDSVRRDPYNEGWLLKVSAPDFRTAARNLLTGSLARRWMEEASERLRAMMGTPAVATALDGGVAVEDLSEMIPEEAREKVNREFFLT